MMATRYTQEDLLFLRQSPLCVKPVSLAPAEEWMGPPPENIRAPKTTATERTRAHDAALLDQTNRRAGPERHNPRNNAFPEDIILGPPRTSFASATSRPNVASSATGNANSAGTANKVGENDKGFRDQDPRDRFNFRSRAVEADSLADRGGDRFRDGRATFRRRGDGEPDSDGWSTVKPRKSFGHEGAERFHHGGRTFRSDQPRDDRKPREKEEPDLARDRPRRTFDIHTRDKDGDDNEPQRRNGLARGKSEPWFKDGNEDRERDRDRDRERDRDRGDRDRERDRDRQANRERIERAKSWRERDPDDHIRERNPDRYHDRRLDRERDSRIERDPEWLDEPAGDRATGPTEEDFKKFMESMKASKGGANKKPDGNGSAQAAPPSTSDLAVAAPDKPKAETAPAIESGPDKFFLNFAASAALGSVATADSESSKDSAQPPMTAKSSRFTSFFSSQEDARRQAAAPPSSSAAATKGLASAGGTSGAASLPPNGIGLPFPQSDVAEKEAFQALLQKLQRQTLQSPNAAPSPPGAGPFPDHAPAPAQAPQQQPQEQQHRPQQAPQPQPQQRQPSQPVQPQQAQPPPPQMLQFPPLQVVQPLQQHQQPSQQGPPPPQLSRQPQPQQQQQQQQAAYQQQQQQLHQQQLQQAVQDARQKHSIAAPDMFQQFAGDRRGPQPSLQDILAPRPVPPSQPPSVRPEQMLQDLVEQRHHAPSQGSGRMDMGPGGAGNAQAEFLMKLMQRQRADPEPRRAEEVLMRMPQPQKQANLPMMAERDLDFQQRERGVGSGPQPQRQMRPPQAPPGMFDDQFHRPDGGDPRPGPQQQLQQHPQHPQHPHPQHPQHPQQQHPPQPPQPTQILQRPPPGLDHQMHPAFLATSGQGPPLPQQRGPMIPPPGLVGGPGGPPVGGPGGPGGQQRPPMPGMFPPNFPPGAFPPPNDIINHLRMQPPPGFYGGPPPPQGPPTFMAPPGLVAFQAGPDGSPFGGPFDGRGMPPGAGAPFRR